MKINEIQNPASCECGSKQFAISKVRLNSTGPYLDAIVCTNPNCKITYGQVEPNSITTNLARINEVMSQVTNALDTFNQLMSSRSNNDESNYDKTGLTAKSAVASTPAPNPAPAQIDQNGIKPTASAEVKPEEDPASPDPEADQLP